MTIGNGITRIRNTTFLNCSNLTKITIGKGVTEIEKATFSGCTGELIINSKIVEMDNPRSNYDSYPINTGWLYGSNFTKLTIGDNVTKVGDYTFYKCYSLTSVTIGKGVTSIGTSAFYRCSSLKDISFPDGLLYIGFGSFDSCTSLTSVTIPDSVTEIGSNAFKSCTSLKNVTIGEDVSWIGGEAFRDCSLTSVYCKPITPPAGSNYMFADNPSDFKIYVPTASVDAYKADRYWSIYASYIVGYDFN